MPKRRKLDKYTLKSGRDVAFERHGTVLIQVIDTGVGMSERQLKSLFQDGTQFNVNELQAGQGSGLGLFISKGMVTQHGGELKASSAGLGCGSTFTLQLPLYHIPADDPVKKDTCTSISTVASMSAPLALEPTASGALSSQLPLPPQDVVPQSPLNMSSNMPSPVPVPTLSQSSPSLRILVVDDVPSNRKLISR